MMLIIETYTSTDAVSLKKYAQSDRAALTLGDTISIPLIAMTRNNYTISTALGFKPMRI
jgi:hypothetical protein